MRRTCMAHARCCVAQAVVAFVRALCAVSQDELQNTKTPRIYSMARLVEVAHFNMTRIR